MLLVVYFIISKALHCTAKKPLSLLLKGSLETNANGIWLDDDGNNTYPTKPYKRKSKVYFKNSLMYKAKGALQ